MPTTGHGTSCIPSDCASRMMNGERSARVARLFFLLRWCRPAVLRVPSSKGRVSPSLLLSPTRSPPQPGRDCRTPPSHSGCTQLVQKLMPIWKADVQLTHTNLRRPSWEPQRRTWRVDPRSKNHAHVELRERRTWCTRSKIKRPSWGGSGAHGPRSADMGTRQGRSARLCFPTRGSVARRRNGKRSCCRTHKCERRTMWIHFISRL